MAVGLLEAIAACEAGEKLFYLDTRHVAQSALVVAADETGVLFDTGLQRPLREVYGNMNEVSYAAFAHSGAS